MITLLLATRNAHKIEEIRAIIGQAYAYLSLKDLPDAPEAIEDAGTFAGNATKKSIALAKWTQHSIRHTQGLYVLADDSGLEVDALHGAPGVLSARFAALENQQAGTVPDAQNNAKMLRLLKDVRLEKRTARFRCVIALTPILNVVAKSASPVCAADECELQTEVFDG